MFIFHSQFWMTLVRYRIIGWQFKIMTNIAILTFDVSIFFLGFLQFYYNISTFQFIYMYPVWPLGYTFNPKLYIFLKFWKTFRNYLLTYCFSVICSILNLTPHPKKNLLNVYWSLSVYPLYLKPFIFNFSELIFM